MKDNRGFLWIGTADGLNRYDGKNFVHYFHSLYTENSIPNNNVHALLQVDKGMIWIGTFNGLCKLNPLNNEITRVPFPDYLKNTEIISVGDIEQNPFDGSLWFASNKGLFYLDQKKNVIAAATDSESYLKSQFITRIYIPSKEVLWLTSYDGLIRYERTSGKIEVFRPSSTTDLKQTLITSIYPDKNGLLWLGTWGRGLQSFDTTTKKFTRYLSRSELGERSDANIIQEVSQNNLPEDNGILWLAGDPIFAFNTESKEFISFGSKDKNDRFGLFGEALSFCNGKDEGVWIGSTNGLYRRDPHHQLFRNLSIVLPDRRHCLPHIFAVYADPVDEKGNTLLVSTWTCGSYKVDVKQRKITPFPAWMQKALAHESYFKAFHRDKSGNLWATTSANGLHLFDEQKKQFRSFYPPIDRSLEKPGNLGKIVEDAQGNFWLGSIHGLFYFDRKKELILPVFYSGFQSPENVSHEIKSMELDTNGNLWFCTNLGLNKKSVVGKILSGSKMPILYFYNEDQPNCFPERSPLESLTIDKQNNIWCATWNGIVYWNANDTTPVFKRLTREDGLCNDKVHKVGIDKQQRIWMATLMGLSCYDPASKRFRNFFSGQGLHEDQIGNLFENKITGELVATYAGSIDVLNPAELPLLSKPPLTVITSLKVFNQPYSQNKKFFMDRGIASLNPTQNMLTVSFSSLSFTDPNQVKYAYKLDGIDKDWIISSNDFATYHNLSPGKRRFWVKARNADGSWNEEGSWMDLHLAPPFYKTWWFITALVLIFLSGIYAIYYSRIRSLKEKFRIRSTIARDLHDEIGSTLTSINILSKVSHTNLERDKSKASDLIQKITEQSESMQQSMSDIIWAIKPENDKLRDMAIRMREYLSHTLESKDITIRFLAEENVMEESLNMEQRRDFFLIFKEAVNNAAKYSQSKDVQVDIKKSGNGILLSIRDQGKGFVINGLQTTNGLKNMQARATALRANLSITSSPGKGTTVQLILPAT